MLTCTAHYREFLDDRGQRYVVRLCEGMAVGVVQLGPVSERIEWRREWGRYHPQHNATAERLVAEFDRRLSLQREPRERINDLLFAASRQPAAARHVRHAPTGPAQLSDRQLPVSDRA